MHELPFVMSLLEESANAASTQGLSRITAMKLQVGALSGIEPECVRLYFETAAEGTPAEGALLEFETVPATLVCTACGERFPFTPGIVPAADYDPFRCPACGGDSLLDRNSAKGAALIAIEGN